MNNIVKTLGATNSKTIGEREPYDFYATNPRMVKKLLEVEKFNLNILEPCVGLGHISAVLEHRGYKTYGIDIINRGSVYQHEISDFLQYDKFFNGDIITNPPFRHYEAFIRKSLEIIPTGNRVAILGRILALEGKSRGNLYAEYPPQKVYVFSSRQVCAINGEFEKVKGSAQNYAWYIWLKGYRGETVVNWIN